LAIFDPYLEQVHGYVEGMRAKYGLLGEMQCPAVVSEALGGLPVRVGPRASSGIIFKEDTFVELGSPNTASCAFVLWSDNPALIRDGRITLVGPDIGESQGQSLPFAQVLMLGGRALQEEEQEALDRSQYVFDQIEGYMLRSVPQRMWSRVSREAVEKGFGFETLGRALMGICKTQLPKVEAMEILFVTSCKEDVTLLENIAAQVTKISREIRRSGLVRRLDGTYECTMGYHCDACSDKPVCDDIRELVALRKTKGRRPARPRNPSPDSVGRTKKGPTA
jgi:CO dehydrogenase/acetyl-CoA synthase beta subunit